MRSSMPIKEKEFVQFMLHALKPILVYRRYDNKDLKEFEEFIGPINMTKPSILNEEICNLKILLEWTLRIQKSEHGFYPVPRSLVIEPVIHFGQPFLLKNGEDTLTCLCDEKDKLIFSNRTEHRILASRMHEQYLSMSKTSS